MFKLILVGDSMSGKTSIINRYCFDTYNPSADRTMNVDSINKDLENIGSIQIWDTLGQELFRSMNRHYYKRTDACVVVVDVTVENFKKQLDFWLNEFIQNNDNFKEIIEQKKSMASSNAPSSDDLDFKGNKIVLAVFLNKIDRIEDSLLQSWIQDQENELSYWCDN